MAPRPARGHLPRRQRLVGAWLLVSGLAFFSGALLALWLDAELAPSGIQRIALWAGSLGGGVLILLLGLLLERRLFTPLRHLQVQMARLAANPDARDDYPPEGWLKGLGPDLARLRDGWRQDRQQLATAHTEGARSAARIRLELESLLQVLETPLLLCDQHRRILLFNHAVETLFDGHPGLGLGKRLEGLIGVASLQDALARLPNDGAPRELLVPSDERWLRCLLKRVPQSQGETLITLTDTTASLTDESHTRAALGELLPSLRRHGAGLASAAETLSRLAADQTTSDNHPLRARITAAIDEESRALTNEIERLSQRIDDLQQQGERLVPLWSNDLWKSLNERLDHLPALPRVTPIGMPAWFKGDAPALLALLEALLERLHQATGRHALEGELCLGNRRVYLDLIWRGSPLPQRTLTEWHAERLESLPLAPTIGELLLQHGSDAWSLADDDGEHARLRLPLPAVERVGAPAAHKAPRPEFHDFGIADLPPPDAELAACSLRALEIVAFDTETTGLELRRGDTVISLGGCRVVNARLLADDTFDMRVDPGRPIPPASTVIHGLRDADVAGAPPLHLVLPRFRRYVGEAVLLAHNAAFDLLAIHPPGAGVDFQLPVLDTLLLSRALDPSLDGHDLDSLASRFDLNIPEGARHTALGDARLTAELWLALLPRLEARGVITLQEALTLQAGAFDREDASA